MLLTTGCSVGKKEQVETKDDFQWNPPLLSEKQSVNWRQVTLCNYIDALGSGG